MKLGNLKLTSSMFNKCIVFKNNEHAIDNEHFIFK